MYSGASVVNFFIRWVLQGGLKGGPGNGGVFGEEAGGLIVKREDVLGYTVNCTLAVGVEPSTRSCLCTRARAWSTSSSGGVEQGLLKRGGTGGSVSRRSGCIRKVGVEPVVIAFFYELWGENGKQSFNIVRVFVGGGGGGLFQPLRQRGQPFGWDLCLLVLCLLVLCLLLAEMTTIWSKSNRITQCQARTEPCCVLPCGACACCSCFRS